MTDICADAPATSSGTDTVSVIMPVYNGAATLRQSLAPLLRMRRVGEIVEIVVVDDGSTDDTVTIARDLGARVMTSGGRLGPGGARNVAAAQALGAVLWFVDADVIVHDDAARVLADTLRRTGSAAVFGTYDDRPPARNFLSQYKNLVHHHYHQREEGDARTFWAGCGAVRTAAFLAVGGFDARRYHRPSIEDIELGLRLYERGYRISLAPALQGTHLKVWRLANLLHTEIFCRALPWSRLMHAHPGWPASLNVGRAERWRAVLAIVCVASLVPAVLWPWTRALLLALLVAAVAANAKLWTLMRRRGGTLFALRGVLFHQVYYLYGSTAFAFTWLERRLHMLRGWRRRENSAASRCRR